MDDLIWDKGYKAGRNLGRNHMETLAKQAGLSSSRFKRDIDGDSCRQIIRDDQAQLKKVGTRGTPAFFINGRFLSGARPIQHFKTLIDEELAKANARIRAGTSVRKYYKEHVLIPGKKEI